VPSAFLEEVAEVTNANAHVIPTRAVITHGIPVAADEDGVRSAIHAATIERLRAAGTLSPYNGLIEAPDLMQQLSERLGETRVWSATQLESFAKCPWSFFSARLLYLEKLEDPDIDIDPRVRGTLLHDALHRFFDKARERTQAPVSRIGVSVLPASRWMRPSMPRTKKSGWASPHCAKPSGPNCTG
jgi:hypothetical protein